MKNKIHLPRAASPIDLAAMFLFVAASSMKDSATSDLERQVNCLASQCALDWFGPQGRVDKTRGNVLLLANLFAGALTEHTALQVRQSVLLKLFHYDARLFANEAPNFSQFMQGQKSTPSALSG